MSRHCAGTVLLVAALAAGCPKEDFPAPRRPSDHGEWTELGALIEDLGGVVTEAPPQLFGLAIAREARALAPAGAAAPDLALLIGTSGAMGPSIPHVGDCLETLEGVVEAGGRVAIITYADRGAPDAVRLVLPFGSHRAALAAVLSDPEKTLVTTWGEHGAAAVAAALDRAMKLPWRPGAKPALLVAGDPGFEADAAELRGFGEWARATTARLAAVRHGRREGDLLPPELRDAVGLEVAAFAGRLGATLRTTRGARAALREARALSAEALLEASDPRSLDLVLLVDGVVPRPDIADGALARTLAALVTAGARVSLVRAASRPGAPASIEVVAPFGAEPAAIAGALAGPAPDPARVIDGRALDLWAALDGTIRAMTWAPGRTPAIVALLQDTAVHVPGVADEATVAWVRAHRARVHVIAARKLAEP